MKMIKAVLFLLLIISLLFAVGCGKESLPEGEGENNPAETASEEISVSVDYATEEFLSKFNLYKVYIEFEDEGYQRIAFTTTEAVKDFKFIEVGHRIEKDNFIFFEENVLCSIAELLPEEPLVVTWLEQGTIPHRGISFIDAEGITRYFSIAMSGKDGSLLLIEF